MRAHFPVYGIGHFLNQPAHSIPFALTWFDAMPEPDVDDPHRHTFYEIIWVDAGRSRQAIDDVEYELQPQSLFFISPGQLHFFEAYEHLRGGSVLFTEDYVRLHSADENRLFELSFLDNFYANPRLMPGADDFAELRQTIDWLDREQRRPDASTAVLQPLLHVLLAQIQRCVDRQPGVHPAKASVVLFKKLKHLLDDYFTQNWSVSDYASALSVTAHHLNRSCRQVTGQTAGQVIRARSLLEARRLLAFTDLTVGEIADALGYADSSYFARLFRSATGTSPAAFRQTRSQTYRTRSDSF